MKRDDVSVLENRYKGIYGVFAGFRTCIFDSSFYLSRLEGRLRYLGRFGYLKLK